MLKQDCLLNTWRFYTKIPNCMLKELPQSRQDVLNYCNCMFLLNTGNWVGTDRHLFSPSVLSLEENKRYCCSKKSCFWKTEGILQGSWESTEEKHCHERWLDCLSFYLQKYNLLSLCRFTHSYMFLVHLCHPLILSLSASTKIGCCLTSLPFF